MEKYVKLFTSPTFKREEFVELLMNMEVEAAPVNDGIILNQTRFNEIPVAYLPHWVYLNRNDINSKLHTRPSNMREFRNAQSAEMGIKLVGTYATSAFGGWEFGQDDEDVYYRCVYDNYVGEWEKVEDYDIADDECTIIYHLRGGMDVLSSDIMRVGA